MFLQPLLAISAKFTNSMNVLVKYSDGVLSYFKIDSLYTTYGCRYPPKTVLTMDILLNVAIYSTWCRQLSTQINYHGARLVMEQPRPEPTHFGDASVYGMAWVYCLHHSVNSLYHFWFIFLLMYSVEGTGVGSQTWFLESP